MKNQVQSVLHAYLIPRFPGADERLVIERRPRELDRLGEDLAVLEKELARFALKDGDCRRLLSVAGITMAVAVGIKSAVGTIDRFSSPQKLVGSFGLNTSLRQSGHPFANLGAAPHSTAGSPSKAAPTRSPPLPRRAKWPCFVGIS